MDATDLPFQTVFTQDHHFVFKDITVVLLQQLLIGEVYAELFEGVLAEVFETKNIKEIDRAKRLGGVRVECDLDLVDYELEDRVVEGFSKSISVGLTTIFTISFEHRFFSLEDLFLKNNQLLQRCLFYLQHLGHFFQVTMSNHLTRLCLIGLMSIVFEFQVAYFQHCPYYLPDLRLILL